MHKRGYPLPRAHSVSYGYITNHFDRNVRQLEVIVGTQGQLNGLIRVWDIVASVFFVNLEQWELNAVIDGSGPRYRSHQQFKDCMEIEKAVAKFKNSP